MLSEGGNRKGWDMSRRILLVWVIVLLGSLPVQGQVPFPSDLLPTRTALGRLGLERQWIAVVPLVNEERVLSVSMSDGLFFAQTNRANFHVYNAETGEHLWSAKIGIQTARPRPASVNSFAVYVANMNKLYSLDRKTGRTIWTHDLGTLPSSATACDENRVVVGLGTGKIYAYDLKVRRDGKATISDHPIDLWNWQTGAIIKTRPMLSTKLAAFGSNDGKVYVALSEERTMLYRIATGGPIGQGLGAFGTRLLLIPSEDRNLYGVDILTSKILWTYPSGAAITQEPLVADNDIYVVNAAGQLTLLDPSTGSPRWLNSTQGGRLVAIGSKRIYLESHDEDLFIIDRSTGQTIADPQATFGRVGLNLRPYEFAITNRDNDRLYFATSSGMVVSLREIGQTAARPLRDPKGLPFGYIPREGTETTPPPARPAALETSPSPDKAKAVLEEDKVESKDPAAPANPK